MTQPKLSYLNLYTTDPAWNLAAEQYVFDALPRDRTYFMLWQNDNAIIIGKHQNAAAEIDQQFVRENGVRVVRRLSGGGAVYHDMGNLNFTFIADAGSMESINFKLFCQPVVAALAALGVQAEVNGRNDMTINGQKFSGNSQYLKEGRVMHHGTIMFDSDLDRVAQALDLYVSGSLNVFNHRTNIDIKNRIVAFDIKELGKQLKKIGMLIVQDAVWNRVTVNREAHKSTRYYIDEMHLLLREEQTAAYTVEIWKRFRKWGGIPTGITQNVQDCLTNDTAYAMLANSEFVVMLRQTKDIDSVVELYGLSEPQRKYLLLAQPGEGIIKMGNSLIPFNNPQPKDTKTYKLLTTKPGEME